MKSITVFIFLFLVLVCLSEAQAAKLTKREFRKHSDTRAVVLIDVSWGRRWNCGGYENAQLLELIFENTQVAEEPDEKYRKIVLETPSRLFVDPVFTSYGFIVDSGKYAFTGWSMKVARSQSNVGRVGVNREQLVDGDTYHGGTFEVGVGEVVYIGNFFIDCYQQPIPWRYYTDGEDQLSDHYQHYKSKFKFLEDAEIIFRLFESHIYAEDPLFAMNNMANVAMAKGEYAEALQIFKEVLEGARKAENDQYAAFAMYGLGRANGHSCSYEKAIKWFKKSIEARKSLHDSSSGSISQNYLELARVYVSMGDFSNAVTYYKLGIEKLEAQDFQSDDPIGYANLLEVYQGALNLSGASREANEVELKIEQLRKSHLDEKPKYVEQPYPTECETEP